MTNLKYIQKLYKINKTDLFNEFILEEYEVFMGFYYNYLLELIIDNRNPILIRDNIALIEELLSHNDLSILSLKEDFLLEIFCDFGYINEVYVAFSSDLKCIYNETIKEWITTFKLFNIKFDCEGSSYIFLLALDSNNKEFLLIDESYNFYKLILENLELIKFNKTYYEIYDLYPSISDIL